MNIEEKQLFSLPGFVDEPYPWVQHIPFAKYLIEVLKPDTFVELGTHSGNSYFAFCQAVCALNITTKCYAIDSWIGDEHASFYGEDIFQRVNKINEDNFKQFSVLMRMRFDEGLNYFSNKSIDLLHIDGLHTYAAVKHDFESWLPKISERGVVIFHDTNVRERDFGVWKLFEELEKRYTSFQFLHGYGLGIACIGKDVNPKFIEFVKNAQSNPQIRSLFSALGDRIQLREEKHDLELELNQSQIKISEMNSVIRNQNIIIAELEELKPQLDKQKTQNLALSQEISGIKEQLNQKENHIRQLDIVINHKDKELDSLNALIKAIKTSKSWEITSPLRALIKNLIVTKQILTFFSKIGIFALTFKFKKLANKLKQLKSINYIKRSSQFDSSYYLTHYSDIRNAQIDGIIHYVEKGANEGRNPSPDFDSLWYLQQNPDVKNAGVNPFYHYLKYGIKENRHPIKEKDTFDVNLLNITNNKEVHSHNEMVDIIICVHNALEDVKKCISNIKKFTPAPYNLILVDDGSSEPTSNYLQNISKTQNTTLIKNQEAQGYTKAANQGLKASNAPYIMLLNSDTIVGSSNWLDRMIMCLKSEDRIGVVSPLSNTASWQSIPELSEGGDWSQNPLPEDISIEQMAARVESDSAMIYPKIRFLNGFCLLMKKTCLESVGYFDEEVFAKGYGEENDFCIRALKKNWKLAVADDVYIYHAQSKSYSHSRRLKLSKLAGEKLEHKHGSEIISKGVDSCQKSLLLHGIRSRSKYYSQIISTIEKCRSRFSGKKILFILPIAGIGGGGNVIISEIKAMRKMSIDAQLANLTVNRCGFEESYHLPDIPIIYFENPESLAIHLEKFDVVVGSAWLSVYWIEKAIKIARNNIITGYYIQDFEPYFFEEGSNNRKLAQDTYTILPQLKCFTKTEWNRNEVFTQTGRQSEVIGPSLNLDIFRPCREKDFSGKIVITAMVRLDSPRRGPRKTLELFKAVKDRYKEQVEIITFGCKRDEAIIEEYSHLFDFQHLGILSSEKLSKLFCSSHIFIDMSSFQAMGLTGMEAMACGNVVMMPEIGGASSFVEHQTNGFLINTSTNDDCLNTLEALLSNRQLFGQVVWQAVKDINKYSQYFTAANIVSYLFQDLSHLKLKLLPELDDRISNTKEEFFKPNSGLEIEAYLEASDMMAIHHIARYRWAMRVLENIKPGKLIDIACGSGYGSYLLAKKLEKWQVLGVDYDPQAIRYARENYKLPNLNFCVGDMETWKSTDNLGISDLGSYSAITSFDTIEHLEHPEIALMRITKMLSMDGLFLISTPISFPETNLKPDWWAHKIEYGASDLENLLKRFFNKVILPDNKEFPNIDYWNNVINRDIVRYKNIANPIVCKNPIK